MVKVMKKPEVVPTTSYTWINDVASTIDCIAKTLSPSSSSSSKSTTPQQRGGRGLFGNNNNNLKQQKVSSSRPILFRAFSVMLFTGLACQIWMVYYLQVRYNNNRTGHHNIPNPYMRQVQQTNSILKKPHVPSPLEEQEMKRNEYKLTHPDQYPILIIGGSDGSGTRGVVDILQSLYVDVVYEDRGTMDVHGQEMFNGKGWPELVKLAFNASGGSAYYDLHHRRRQHRRDSTRPSYTSPSGQSQHINNNNDIPTLDERTEDIVVSEMGKMFHALRIKYLSMKRQVLSKTISKQQQQQRATTTTALATSHDPFKATIVVPKAKPGAKIHVQHPSPRTHGEGKAKIGPHRYDQHMDQNHRRLLFSSSAASTPVPEPNIVLPREASKISFAFKAPATMLLLPILAKVWTNVKRPLMMMSSADDVDGTNTEKNGKKKNDLVPIPFRFKFLHVVRDGRDVAMSDNQSPVKKFYNSTYPKDYVERRKKYQGNLSYVKGMQLWNDWNVQAHEWAMDHPHLVDYMYVRVEDLLGVNGVPKRLEVLHALADFVGSPLSSSELCCLSLERTKDKGTSSKNAGEGGPGGRMKFPFRGNARARPASRQDRYMHYLDQNYNNNNKDDNNMNHRGESAIGPALADEVSGFGSLVRDALNKWHQTQLHDPGPDGGTTGDNVGEHSTKDDTNVVYITPIRAVVDGTIDGKNPTLLSGHDHDEQDRKDEDKADNINDEEGDEVGGDKADGNDEDKEEDAKMEEPDEKEDDKDEGRDEENNDGKAMNTGKDQESDKDEVIDGDKDEINDEGKDEDNEEVKGDDKYEDKGDEKDEDNNDGDENKDQEEEADEENDEEADHRRRLMSEPVEDKTTAHSDPKSSFPPPPPPVGLQHTTIQYVDRFLKRVDFWKNTLTYRLNSIDEANDAIHMGNDLGVQWDQLLTRIQKESGDDGVKYARSMFDIDEVERLMDDVQNKIQSGKLQSWSSSSSSTTRTGHFNKPPAVKGLGITDVKKRYGKWQEVLEKNEQLAAAFYAEGEAGLRIFGYHPVREIQYGHRINSITSGTNTTTTTATNSNATASTTVRADYQCNVNDPTLKTSCLAILPRSTDPRKSVSAVTGSPPKGREVIL